jgi:hypothetical protein
MKNYIKLNIMLFRVFERTTGNICLHYLVEDYQLPREGPPQFQRAANTIEAFTTAVSPSGLLSGARHLNVEISQKRHSQRRNVLVFNMRGMSTVAYADKLELRRLKALARRIYDPTNIVYDESIRPPRPKNEILVKQRVRLLIFNWTNTDGVFTAEYEPKETKYIVTKPDGDLQ